MPLYQSSGLILIHMNKLDDKTEMIWLDIARHKSVLSFVELGTDLYCDLSRILKRRVDFAENVLKENYKVGLLKKDINGTIDIEGEKYTLIV